jgi:hypothetical protein
LKVRLIDDVNVLQGDFKRFEEVSERRFFLNISEVLVFEFLDRFLEVVEVEICVVS